MTFAVASIESLKFRARVVRIATVCLIAAAATAVAVAADQPRKYVGRPVAEVLQELRAAGLPILFSSDLVPLSLRVKSEPTGRDRRQIAVQILAPHALTIQEGPRGMLLVVADRKTAPPVQRQRERQPPDAASGQAVADSPRSPETVRIEERVDVNERLVERSIGSTTSSLPPSVVRETAGGFENVFQVFQLLPGAAATNDEDGRLAVRGAGPEHNIVVLDEVQIHNPYRFSELTSGFLNPATAASVALDASGLDARHGGRLSSVTTIETRDGSRDRRLAVSGSMGLANGDVLLEGRLPRSESGSWWLTARGTYYRPVIGLFRSDVLPNFGDLQFKVTARPSRRTSLSVFGLAGRETMRNNTRDLDEGAIGARFTGANRLGLMTLSWTPSSRLVATTTLSAYAHDARDYDDFLVDVPFERYRSVRDFAARQRAVYAITSSHVLELGADVHRVRSAWRMAGEKPPIFWRGIGPSTWGELVEYPPTGSIDSRLARTHVGVWLQDRLPIGRRLSVEPGVRLDWNSFTGESIWQPRLRVAGRVGTTAVWAGFAAQAQTPSHESLQGFDYFQLSEADGANLRSERARQLVAGFERGLGAGFDVRVEAYRRRFDRLLVQRLETGAERAMRLSSYSIPPDLPPDDVILERRPAIYPESTGRGTAAGVEVLLQRNGARASGWVGYTFSKTTREMYGYRFPFDFDRPHTLSAVANVPLSRRFRLSATGLRASGFAVTPLHEEVFFTRALRPDGTLDPIARPNRNRDGGFWMAPNVFMRRLSLRNTDRLSGYSRVDVRLTYSTLGRWEVYGEVINLFGSRNYLQTIEAPSLGGGSQGAVTANNVYETFERLPSFGVRVKF